MPQARPLPGRQALAIAGLYAAVAAVWILLSGWLLDLNIADPALRSAYEYGKGLLFVFVTAGLLWLLVRRALQRERAIAAEREDALRRLADNERAATVGMLASGLAHEFNNLHAVIAGNLELATSRAAGDELLQRRLAAAVNALERASGLTRSLLDFARPGSGERQVVALDRLAAETLELVRRALESDGITVETDLQPVPPVLGDPHQLGQVLMNLMINASHALRQASAKRLRLATRAAAEGVVVEVADTGCGMDTAVRRSLFMPFFTTKRGGSGPVGTGLGLSVSKAMVESHGGSIEVESAVGAGATFRVRLPPLTGTEHAKVG